MSTSPNRKSTRKRGRPETINDDVIEKIKSAIHAGIKKTVDLCAFASISRGAFFEWQIKGRNDLTAGKNTMYAKLVTTMSQAKVNSKAMHAGVVLQAAIKGYPRKRIRVIEHRDAKGNLISTHTFREEIEATPDYKASLEFLERHFPDEWGKLNRVALTWKNKAIKNGASEQELEHVINGIAKSFAKRAGMNVQDDDDENGEFFDQLLERMETLDSNGDMS